MTQSAMPDPTLALCTFSTGAAMVREVLTDWLDFLPRRPDRVIVSTLKHDGDVHPVYRELVSEGLIDELIELDAPGFDGRTAETLGTMSALDAARQGGFTHALQVKLDTLPWRDHGTNEDWLDEALAILQEGNYFAFTGSMSAYDTEPVPTIEGGTDFPPGRYYETQRFSVNFSIFDPDDFVRRVVEALGGDWCLDPVRFVERKGDEQSRFAVESVITQMIEAEGRWCFSRNETPDWSVLHVNVWGERLQAVRDRYRRREGVEKFLNRGDWPRRQHRELWDWQYGTPVPSAMKRLRVKVGRWRRGLS